MAAEKIRDILGPELVTLHNLKDDAPALMEQYDVLILGIPTGILVKFRRTGKPSGSNWTISIWKAKSLRFTVWATSSATVSGSPDALGMLHDKLALKGVKFVGYWPTEGYEFTSNKPVIADGQLFVGLALDETNQYDLSDERIQTV